MGIFPSGDDFIRRAYAMNFLKKTIIRKCKKGEESR